jgi:VanZ family protein
VRALDPGCTLADMIRTQFAVASLWLALVLFLGSAYFAAQETARFVVPLLRWLMPGAPVGQLQAAHMVLRKVAHLTEYAVLGLLWFRAILRVGGWRPRTASWAALSICLVCAFADEAHQSTLPTRHGSARDFLIDAFGATATLTIARGRQSAGISSAPLGEPIAAEPAD